MYTKEYRKGYLAGIKLVLDMVRHLSYDGSIYFSYTDRINFNSHTFLLSENVIQPIKDLYDGLSKSDNSSGLGLSSE